MYKRQMRYCAGTNEAGEQTFNVIDVTLGAGIPLPGAETQRQVLTSSACGICGTTSIDQVRKTVPDSVGSELSLSAAAESAWGVSVGTLLAVSYTHLDVYKRQEQHRREHRPQRRAAGGPGGRDVDMDASGLGADGSQWRIRCPDGEQESPPTSGLRGQTDRPSGPAGLRHRDDEIERPHPARQRLSLIHI